jgi:AraC-like DNA-binding protein
LIQYHTIPPPPHLAPYVRSYWVLQSDAPYTHHGMADGCAELVFHYEGIFDELDAAGHHTRSFSAGLHGPSSKSKKYTINSRFGMFGVYLYPFAINQFFRTTASALANECPDLEALSGTSGCLLEEEIMMAADNNQRVRIMNRFFESCLSHRSGKLHPVSFAVNEIIDKKGWVQPRLLAKKYCLSERQFERRFKEHAGFGAKMFSRIIRFQAVTAEYPLIKKSLTELALECGYYDQSHFIHDFKSFSGMKPGDYFSGLTDATAWRDAL